MGVLVWLAKGGDLGRRIPSDSGTGVLDRRRTAVGIGLFYYERAVDHVHPAGEAELAGVLREHLHGGSGEGREGAANPEIGEHDH